MLWLLNKVTCHHDYSYPLALTKAVQKSSEKPNIVIVGSSFIGMEAASVFAKQANVTVVGMEKVACFFADG